MVPFIRTFLENNLGYPPDQIMFLYLAGGVGAFVTVRFTGRVVDRVGAAPVATFGTALLVACVLVGFVPATPIAPVMLIFVLFMCTASLRGVPLSTVASRLPAPHERAQYMSLQSAVQHLASSAGAITASQIIATAGDGHLVHVDVVVFASIGFALCMPVLLWRVERRVRARLAAAAAAIEAPALPEARAVR